MAPGGDVNPGFEAEGRQRSSKLKDRPLAGSVRLTSCHFSARADPLVGMSPFSSLPSQLSAVL